MRGCSFAVEKVEVVRSGRIILDIDTLKIKAGEFINLIGPNGAGKTTLMQVLCGLIRPERGQVWMNDVELTRRGGWGRSELRRQIGYIPQAAEYNAQLPFTVLEVAVMGRIGARGLFRRLNRDDYDLAEGWLERLGLADRRRQTFRSLSGGERQKVLIARAMAQDPAVLMLDEPTSNLDWNWKQQIVDTICDLHARWQLTIVLISHEMTGLPFEAGRTILLHEGRIAVEGGSDVVLESTEMARIYGWDQTTLSVVQKQEKGL